MSGKQDESTLRFSLLTLNARGLGKEIKRKKIMAWGRDMESDIFLVQESHSSPATERMWKNQVRSSYFGMSHGTSQARGVFTLIRPGLNVTILDESSDEEGRFLWTECEIQGQHIGIANVYAPNSTKEQLDFYKNLCNFIRQKRKRNIRIIVAGDLNVALERKDRYPETTADTQQTYLVRDMVKQIMQEGNLVDIWRTKHPYQKSYSWHQRTRRLASRIDYILIPSAWVNITENARLVHAIETDHFGVQVKLRGLKNRKRGPGIWKMNNSHLKDIGYLRLIKQLLKEKLVHFEQLNPIDKIKQWELIKSSIRIESIAYGKEKASQRRQRELEIQEDLKSIEQQLHNLDDAVLEQYRRLVEEYEALYKERAEKSLVRNKVTWQLEAERATKYFLGLETPMQPATDITQLQADNNADIITNQSKIRSAIQDFYSKLLKTRRGDDVKESKTEFFTQNIPCLSPEDRLRLEENITEEEITEALHQMAPSRSPGEDGLTKEFYVAFWPDLKPVLMQVFQACKTIKSMLQMNRGIIRLIPKAACNLLDIKSYRPITLLCVDYKILSKCLANRMKIVLDDLISMDQVGFMSGRYIGDVIRTLVDLEDYLKKRGLGAICLSLDISKAFDCVEWDFLDKTLEAFGFGPNFIDWMQILRHESYSKAINFGYVTREINISRGTRQGDSVSPYLFLLAVEVLAIAVRNNKDIEGVPACGREYKLMQYADDTTLTLKGESSLESLWKLLKNFGKLSGLETNPGKTVVKGLGTFKDYQSFGNLNVTKEPLKILGYYHHHDATTVNNLNVKDKVAKMWRLLRMWQSRNITLKGKIVVLKSLAIPLLTYSLMNTYVPDAELKSIEKLIFQFIWGCEKGDKIKRVVMMGDYNNGGLRAPNINELITGWRMATFRRLLWGPYAPWSLFVREALTKVGTPEYLRECNFDVNTLQVNLTPFWKQVFEAFSKLHHVIPDTAAKVRGQIINNNRYILCGDNGKSFSLPYLLNNNFMDRLENWIGERGEILSYEQIKGKVDIDPMTYNKIVTAIPKSWKRLLLEDNGNCIDTVSLFMSKQDVKSRLLNLRIKQNPVYLRWQTELTSLGLSQRFAERQSELPHKVKDISIKASIIQYYILHKVIPTNKRLWKQTLVDSPDCERCPGIIDTVQHRFLDCQAVRPLWEELARMYHEKEGTVVSVDLKSVIFMKDDNHFHKWNLLSLWLKQYIHNMTCLHKNLSLHNMKGFLSYNLKILSHTASKLHRDASFSKNWNNWI